MGRRIFAELARVPAWRLVLALGFSLGLGSTGCAGRALSVGDPDTQEDSARAGSAPDTQAVAEPGAAAPRSDASASAETAVAASELEAWALDLVAPPEGRSGARDVAVQRWIQRVADEPDHPLADATLCLVSACSPDLDEPAAYRQAVLALDPAAAYTPAARRRLETAQGVARAREARASDRGREHHPGALRHFEVLGPLGPLGDPWATRIPQAFVDDPGFGRSHEVLGGDAIWLPYERSPYRRAWRPGEVLADARGWLLVAARFDLPDGGPAWLEFDLGSGAGSSFSGADSSVFSFGGSTFSSLVGQPRASFAWSLNGSPSCTVNFRTGERSAVERLPVSLNAGQNVLLMRVHSDSWSAISLAILDAQARPFPGLVDAVDVRPADDESSATPSPTLVWSDSEVVLLGLEDRGPGCEALLGLLQLLDRRPAQGLEHLKVALSDCAPDAPDALGLSALLAGVLAQSSSLPESWRKARSRELIEGVLSQDPLHLAMGLAMAEILAREDKPSEAVELLDRLSEAHPLQARSLLQLEALYRELRMSARAGQTLQQALARAPASPRVLTRAARHTRDGLGETRAAFSQASREAGGRSASGLEQLAAALISRGDLQGALDTWSEVLAYSPSRTRRLRYAAFLVYEDHLDEAMAVLDELIARYPSWAAPLRSAADVALKRGEREAEAELLLRALALVPAHRPTIDRLVGLGTPDAALALHERYAIPAADALAAYDEAGREDSVVRVLDQAVIKVHPDGSTETITHEIVQVRDLAACSREGELRLGGEVLAIATLKAGSFERRQPVRVAGSYVMPQLEPGDFIERVIRSSSGPSSVVRPGAWFFQSSAEPFVISRYVVSVPRCLDLRLESRRFEGSYEEVDEGDSVVHVFEAREQAQVVLEPLSPPSDWFVPWVEFGMDDDPDAILSRIRDQLVPLVEVTPVVRGAAREATRGLSGQTAMARKLHGFVEDAIEHRTAGPVAATQALLSRRGNATLLLAALLSAADIAHDLVWTRGVAPAGDPDPSPAFIEAGRLQRQLLVRVRPDDGPPAWCNMDSRTLPYGELVGSSPGAEAIAVESGERLTLPDRGTHGMPGVGVSLTCSLALDGSAEVSGEYSYLGGAGYSVKEQLRDLPESRFRNIVQSVAASVLPGTEIQTYDVPGLHDDGRVSFRFDGRVTRFLDGDGRPLPLVRLGLSDRLAVEGQRRLPFLQPEVSVETTEVLLRLPEGLELVEPLPTVRLSFEGYDYDLSLTAQGPGEWRLQRTLVTRPFSLDASEYHELTSFARLVDDAEAARLRFRRVPTEAEAPPGR